MYTGPNIVTNGLVLSLDAANVKSYPGSGTTWFDLSGNNITGSLGGTRTPTYNSINNGCISFSTGSITNSNPNLVTGNNAFTKSVWVYSLFKGTGTGASGSLHPNIISWGANSTNNKNGLALQTDNAGNPQLLQWFFGNDYSCSINDITNTWANIAVTYQPPVLTFYLNGTNVSTQNVTGTPNVTNTNLEIGYYSTVNYSFSGSIASVQVFNRALSATEVLQNYNAIKTRFGL